MKNVKTILRRMTIDQKIGQLTQYDATIMTNYDTTITGPRTSLDLKEENINTIGSVLNFKNADEMKRIQNKHLEHDPNKIPIVFMMDVIHGYRTIYPIPLALAGSFNPQLAKECAAMAAKEASLSGVQVTFAPMVDYVRDARWGRVMESGGEEPLLNAKIAVAQIEGFQGNNPADVNHIAVCVKHFAGYGGAEAGRDYNAVELSLRELYEYYLSGYKACIDAGARLLMPSFNSLNGIPSLVNSLLMKKILKDEWDYDGVIISDYNAVNELIVHGVAENQKEAARKAFQNGCDVEMCSSAYFHYLRELVEEGTVTENQIDEAVSRVLEFKNTLGLFEDPFHGANQKKADSYCLCEANRKIAKKAVEECAVLLKNNGLLPLDRKIKKIALIGPYADSKAINGPWKCMGSDKDCISVAEGIRNLLPESIVTVENGCSNIWNDFDDKGISIAVKVAEKSDVVILCLGEPHTYSGEGNSRTDLRLPGMQIELAKAIINANRNTAVVLFNGRPLVLTDLDKIAPAILEMYFPGSEGGNAIAELLFGIANPGGKLTMSFPRAVGQCPIYYNHPNTGRPNWCNECTHEAYHSDYVDCATLPLYPFGFGLSYSHFVYQNIELSSNKLSENGNILLTVKLCNDSDVPGKEVVQVYMHDVVGTVVRPVQQLIAFEKVSLAPHEIKAVSVTLKDEMFYFYDAEGKRIRETGKNVIMVGYADNYFLEETIEII